MNIYFVLIVLGAFQGVAEFLPISSSGHLVILQQISSFKAALASMDTLFVNVVLHIATLIAVLIYFRKDIIEIASGFFVSIFKRDFKNEDFRMGVSILIASVPAGILGLLLNDIFETYLQKLSIVSIVLIINGIILIFTKKIPLKDRQLKEVSFLQALVVGIFQAIAILPGLSRSGMTIAGGMLTGLKPNDAARFSFLMAIPVIAGAGLLEGMKAFKAGIDSSILPPILVSMVITIIVALFSLKILFYFVKKVRVDIFGYYTIAVGTVGILVSIFVLKSFI